MPIRSVFHVSPSSEKAPAKPEAAAPSVEIEVTIEDDFQPRGRSFETWSRARGWASED